MAAEPKQMAGAVRQCLVEMKAADGAPRPLAFPLFQGNQDRGPAIALHQPTGDNTDHSRMPAFIGQHDGTTLIGDPIQMLDRLAQGLLFQGLALAIETIQQRRQFLGVSDRFGEQQLHPESGILQPAGSIEARPQPKADGGAADLLDPGHLPQGLHPRTAGLIEQLQPELGESPVQPLQRSDVGNGSQGHQVETEAQIGLLAAAEPAAVPQDLAQAHQ